MFILRCIIKKAAPFGHIQPDVQSRPIYDSPVSVEPNITNLMSKQYKQGLKERIQTAVSQDGINTLLSEGDEYTNASEATKRGWRKAADKRAAQLMKPA